MSDANVMTGRARVNRVWDRLVWWLLNRVDEYAHRRGVRQAQDVKRERASRRAAR